MALRRSILFLATLLFVLNSVAAAPEPYHCPTECDCHFNKNNWVTDCSDIELTAIPMTELPAYIYELNMNGNLLKKVDRFHYNISLRTLKMSRNFLTEIGPKTFDGLNSLVGLDLSYNTIGYIDQLAFA